MSLPEAPRLLRRRAVAHLSPHMSRPYERLYFDFVDPICWLVECSLVESVAATPMTAVERIGYELFPPPVPLREISDPFWVERWTLARRLAPEVSFAPPALVPWTRKAHELHAFARTLGSGDRIRRRLFEAYLFDGRDIGRVDELVAIASAEGLDPLETKVALDVDRFAEEIVAVRAPAEALGLSTVPALLVDGRLVQDFRNPTELSTLLRHSP